MSEPEEPEAEALTPVEEAEYAELLAAYLPPSGETVPAAVADRLDRRLTELESERQRDVPDALRPDADRAALRRRRRFGGALLAAAAVSVGGFAVGTLATGGGSGSDSESAVSARDGDAGALEDGAAGGAADEEPAEAGSPPESGLLSAALPRVRRDHVEEDVARLLATRLVTATDGQDAPDQSEGLDGEDDGELTADRSSACEVPPLDTGETWFLVRYAGEATVLVADADDAPPPRTARLLPCAGGDPLAEVELAD